MRSFRSAVPPFSSFCDNEEFSTEGGEGGGGVTETWEGMLRRRRRSEEVRSGGDSGAGAEEIEVDQPSGGGLLLALEEPPYSFSSSSGSKQTSLSSLLIKQSPRPGRKPLPPWLARHSTPTFTEPRPGRGGAKGGPNYRYRTSSPSLPSAASSSSSLREGGRSSFITRTGEDAVAVARLNLDILKGALAQYGSYVDEGDGGGGGGGGGLTPSEVDDVVAAVRIAAEGDWKKISGAAEFLCLLLSVEEDQFGDCSFCRSRDGSGRGNGRRRHPTSRSTSLMNRDTLIASAFHYCDCITAQKMGVYDLVSKAVRMTTPARSFADTWNRQLMPSGYKGPALDGSDPWDDEEEEEEESSSDSIVFEEDADEGGTNEAASAAEEEEAPSPNLVGMSVNEMGDIDRFGGEAARIAAGAARIKRAEVLADAVSFGDGCRTEGTAAVVPSQDEASTLRELLLSVADDWRSLAIRSVACLYRLRGILRFGDVDGDGLIMRMARTPEMTKTAREALRVYAPLAERLGMHRLKADLEGLSFRVLYRRQDMAARALYSEGGDAMMEAKEYLNGRVEEILTEDDTLREQVESLRVVSRVKSPFSLWKKLLKKRVKDMEGKDSESSMSLADSAKELSLLDVQDAIALRVILRARRLSPMEGEDSLQTRECLLCYYALKLLIDVWPPMDPSRVKDYISAPKPNGYQSLHYTASIFRHGVSWPFEVQIRSEEMHRTAEYGVAAHWDYKLGAAAVPNQIGKSSFALMSSSEDIAREIKRASWASFGSDTDQETGEVDNAGADEPADSRASVDNKTAGGGDPGTSAIESYIEALTASRDSLKQEKVFVFVSPTNSALDGKILPLRLGASVDEALAEIKQRHGIDCTVNEQSQDGMYRNGKKTDLDEKLSNGDVLTLPISCIVWE